jgi:predicted aspartyl protease
VQLLRRFLLLTQIQIDGASLTALIDTGAGVSMLNARGMHKMGVSPQQIARDPVVSSMALGGRFNANQHRFRTLQLGVTKVDNPTLIVLATPEPAFDMVLGMDILGATRFRLSYAGAWMERG